MIRDKKFRNSKGFKYTPRGYKHLCILAKQEFMQEHHMSHRKLRALYGELHRPLWGRVVWLPL